jgi:aspartate racemase
MKRIGLIGGMGPESTVDYYKELINAFKNDRGDMNYPEIVIFSINISQFLKLMKAKKYEDVTDFLTEKIEVLKKAEVDFAAITANTPHLLFDKIQEKSDIPLISIVEATCSEALKMGLKRPGLLGTGFTMSSTFFQDVFSAKGMEVIVPDPEDREFINYKLFSEIELGIFKDDTRESLEAIIEKMIRMQSIDSVILGCTELPLILRNDFYRDIPMLNTTKIHVNEIVRRCLDNNQY